MFLPHDGPDHFTEEKKVEYLELIYDLVFVYVIGRNNSILRHIEGGFLSPGVYVTYILFTLAVIQIWSFSTFYTNTYGRCSLRDHVFMCVNMFLLYYIADGTSVHWQSSMPRYSIAWALILVNIAAQYLIELRHHKIAPWGQKQIRRKAAILLVEAALVLVSLAVYQWKGVLIAWLPILFGIAATAFSEDVNAIVPVDFPHLTERAMLYVVFTFGEMIIAVGGYFEGDFTFRSAYFALAAFLIVVGLFLSYGLLYNRVVDRDMFTTGVGYMILHVFLILAMNNITAALEFMREQSVDLMPKTLFLIGSFVAYFVFLFLIERFAKEKHHFSPRFRLMLAVAAVSFVALMLLTRELMLVNITLSVLYIFLVFWLLWSFANRCDREEK